ncbi:MAG: helix-turn-helix transcriptional regulator [Candidatus Auribacterota bacterium]|jgi:DNA-binding CsgD family transcriptional regulator|nr:helix-turn-helix transcriptional regulator [Candidatus Auribacterota bacterium]
MMPFFRIQKFFAFMRIAGDPAASAGSFNSIYFWKTLLALALILCAGTGIVLLFYNSGHETALALPIASMSVLCVLLSAICVWSIFAHIKRFNLTAVSTEGIVTELQRQINGLRCLCELSDISNDTGMTKDKILHCAATKISSGFCKPENTGTAITVYNTSYRTENFIKIPNSISAPLKIRGEVIGKIEVCFLNALPDNYFSSEKSFLAEIAGRLENTLERFDTLECLIRYQSELKEQHKALTEKNVALREIVEQIEFEKKKIKEDVAVNVEKLILPSLKKLMQKYGQKDRGYFDMIQKDLHALLSSFGVRLHGIEDNLAPREIEICDMIKNGLPTKEISEILDISPATVDRHRNNIRKKLGLVNNSVNLSTYLQSLA